MKVTLNNRAVEIVDFEFSRYLEDSYISDAYYINTEEPLSDDELEQLTNEYQELVYQEHAEYWQGVAEAWAEGER